MNESAFAAASLNEGRSDATAATLLVNLNTTLKTVFELQKERLQRLQTILRCDLLPSVKGTDADWTQVFTRLTDIILNQPPHDSKLFIYIKCELKKEQPIRGDQLSDYAISIHTNTGGEADWEKTYATTLTQCGAACNAAGGSFVYHMVSNSSCLFTLNLPGILQ